MKDLTILSTIVLFAVIYGALWSSSATNVKHLLDDLVAAYVMAWALYGAMSDLPRVEFRKRFLLMTASLVFCA
jgi:hypothetical protein